MSGELATRGNWSLDVPSFRRELQAVEAVPEVKRLRDMADAAQVLSMRQGLTADAILCAEGKIWAERRLGELLAATPINGQRGVSPAVTPLPSLPDGIGRMQSSRWQQIARIPEADVEQWLAAQRKAQEPARLARLLRIGREAPTQEAPPEPSGDMDLREGDLRDVLGDLDGKVDAIVTDPPYPAKFIEEFDALGDAAARILKPSGLLVAMVGQTHLPAYIERLSRHLTYRWCGAYLTDGPATRIHGRKVGTKWKPLLIFGGEEFITQDVFASVADDKQHHHWGQSESGFADIIERLTKPGELVVDPFLGGGTTAVVCRDLGRAFVGCDIDPSAITTTKRRLAA